MAKKQTPQPANEKANLANKPVGGAEVIEQKTIRQWLTLPSVQQSMAAVLPKTLTVEKLTKVALVAVSRSPRLLECTPDSLVRSVMDAAKVGLPPDGTLGQGYLVPFWNSHRRCLECQFIPGYRGFLSLARRSGQIQAVSARLVYADDDFEISYGDTPGIVHRPSLTTEPADENITGAYFVARLKDGSDPIIEYMTLKQLESIRDRSPSKNRQGEVVGPWKTDFGEMCRKTVTRRGCKWVPMSIDEPLAQALEYEDRQDRLRELNGADMALELPDAPGVNDVIDGEVSDPVRDLAEDDKQPAAEQADDSGGANMEGEGVTDDAPESDPNSIF